MTLIDPLDANVAAQAAAHGMQGDELWMQLAEAKWGHHVAKLAQVAPGGWAAWTKHRLVAGRLPISPLDLVQVG